MAGRARLVRGSAGRAVRGAIAAVVVAALAAPGLVRCPPAAAQPRAPGGARGSGDGDLDLERLVEAVVDLVAAVGDRTQERVFRFLETVELFDLQTEIDRLVGSPWELNDATTYKLSLLPFHIRYPIYKQLVRQMTRHDELRSRRIHTVTPDAVSLIALRIGTLSGEPDGEEIRHSLLTHFSAREIADLGFFVLAQQRFFPETEEGWGELKRSIARSGGGLALGGLLLGAAFNAGAFSRSGGIARFGGGALRLGWYGGFRRLGMHLRPQLRGGLTAQLPGFELALGLADWTRPGPREPELAVELAVREGWLGRLARPLGWDAFFEGAARRVLAASPRYEGPTRAARLGFFLRRDELPGLETFALRASAEAETDFAPPLRGAVGLGLEHVPTGIATLLQGSRTLLRDEARPAADVDTRGGVFVVGTIEPPTSIFVGGMKTRARLVHEEWQEIAAIEARVAAAEAKLQRLGRRDVSGAEAAGALEALARARASLDEHLARLTARVAEYLESRRRVYALLHWARPADDLYGPLDPAILAGVRARVVTRLEELAAGLRPVPGRLARLRRRHQHVRDALTALERDGAAAGPAGRAYAVERAALEATWRREAEAAGTLLDAYLDQRDGVRRIAEASRRAVAWREAEPLELQVIRAVAAVGPTP